MDLKDTSKRRQLKERGENMIKRSLIDIAKMAKGSGLKREHENIIIKGVSTDSRTIEEGQLFIPLIGEKFNGHLFVEDAYKKGAKAALWNKNEPLPNIDIPLIFVEDTLMALQDLARAYRAQLKVKVIGITGSNGKTTTKDIVASVLSTRYKTKKTLGNLNNDIGCPLTLLNLDEDTEMAVIEMGTERFGEISNLTNIAKPDVAIITSIGRAHLENLYTEENIARAKLEILEGLDPNGLFIYFGDDPTLRKVLKDFPIEHKVLTYGSEESNDYVAKVDSMNEEGISFTLKAPYEKSFFLPLLGKHNVFNGLAAIVVGEYFNVPANLIQEAFNHIDKTGMRDELIHAKGFTILNDSYKSNPDSLLVQLETLYNVDKYSQKIVVLGDMLGLGEDEVRLHEEVGKSIDGKEIDYVFTIGPLAKYLGEACKASLGTDRVIHLDSKEKIVEEVKKVIKPNSIVLVKASRSLELEDIVYALKEEVVLN